MNITQRPAKWTLILAWIISVITAIITAPIAFIAGAFASDSGTSAAIAVAYSVMASPIIFLILPIIAQVLYSRGKYRAAGILSIVMIAAEILAIGFLVHFISGMSFS